jgi:hypothetical protein
MSLRYAPQGSVNCLLVCPLPLGGARKGVPLPIPSPIRTIFLYVAVKHIVWCRIWNKNEMRQLPHFLLSLLSEFAKLL